MYSWAYPHTFAPVSSLFVPSGLKCPQKVQPCSLPWGPQHFQNPGNDCKHHCDSMLAMRRSFTCFKWSCPFGASQVPKDSHKLHLISLQLFMLPPRHLDEAMKNAQHRWDSWKTTVSSFSLVIQLCWVVGACPRGLVGSRQMQGYSPCFQWHWQGKKLVGQTLQIWIELDLESEIIASLSH